jgi:hypothetical protein
MKHLGINTFHCKSVFLNCWAVAQYQALASITTGHHVIKKEFTGLLSYKG